jgi:archaellum component FlaC
MTTELYTTIVTTGFIVSTAVAGGCIWHLLAQNRERKRQELMDYMNNHIESVTTRFNYVWDEINKMSDRLDNAGYLVNDMKDNIADLQADMKDNIADLRSDVNSCDSRITDSVSNINRAIDDNSSELESFRNEVTDMLMRSIDDINTDIEQWKTEHNYTHNNMVRDNDDSNNAIYRYVDSVVDDIRSEMSCKVKKTK